MNNAAFLKSYLINPSELKQEWKHQLEYSKGFNFSKVDVYPLDFFTIYFQKLLTDLLDKLGPSKNIRLQIHDKNIVNAKYYLGNIHKDAARLIALTIPIIVNDFEPINFYDENIPVEPRNNQNERKKMGIAWRPASMGAANFNYPIEQRVHYSKKHPTLLNVNKFHNVRILNDELPRVLLQLSYDIDFDTFVSKNPTDWEVL